MSRQRSYLVDNMVSSSFLLSWDKTDVAGKTYRVTIPMQGAALDMRGVQPAYFSTFEDVKCFAPDGVKVLLAGVDKAPSGGALAKAAYDGGDGYDPARDVRYSLELEIVFAADVDSAADVPLSVWGKPIATGVAEPNSWPSISATNNPDITITTTGGTPVSVAAAVQSTDVHGDMTKAVYDTDDSGVVDEAESVDWSGVDNKPSSFTPSAHAATHEHGGADEVSLDASQIASGVIAAARLPSYVDDVLEYTNLAAFPATGETGKIYVAKDTNNTYRWSGSAYVQIGGNSGAGTQADILNSIVVNNSEVVTDSGNVVFEAL